MTGVTSSAPDAVPPPPLGAGMAEPVDRDGAFPRLTEPQRARLRAVGIVRQVQPGEILFREGEEDSDLVVIESGAVAIVSGYGQEDRVIAVHGAHRFVGELGLLTGCVAYVTAVVRDAGEVIHVSRSALRQLLRVDDDLAKLILFAFLARRSILVELGAGVRVLGWACTPSSVRVREFLARNRVPHQWVDLSDPEVAVLATALADQEDRLPLVISGQAVLRNPSNAELAAALRLGARSAPSRVADLLIVGGGPAGLAAAVYGASEGLDTVAVDTVAFGGQASTSSRIENYLGFPTGITGANLAERAIIQAGKFGARLVVAAEASALSTSDEGVFSVTLADGREYRGRTVIVATGARYRRLDVAGIDRWAGAGVYYAATPVEAQRCHGKPVVVVGGGNSAGQAALFLARRTLSCHLVIRGDCLAASMSQYLVDQVEADPNITVLTGARAAWLHGGDALEAVTVLDADSGERRLAASGLFVFIGASPCTGWLPESVITDRHGFLLTGRDIPAEALDGYGGDLPLALETSEPGVFAVGDVRAGSVKRVASAVGEGSMAVRLVHDRLAARMGRPVGV